MRIHDSHQLLAAVASLAGLTSVAACKHDIRLDEELETLLDTTPAMFSNAEQQRFEFHATVDVDGFTCILDGESRPCSSPFDAIVVTEGTHHFSVAAAGDESPATFDWTYDVTRPRVAVTAKPAAVDNSRHERFEFTADEQIGAFACAIDGAAPGPCASPLEVSLSNGAHHIQITGTDLAGNISDPFDYDWSLDDVGPDTTLTSTPRAATSSTAASFAFEATGHGPFAFACRIDGEPAVACTSPFTVPAALGEGWHFFSVQTTDGDNVVDPSPASFGWIVDLSAPVVTFTDRPSDPSNVSWPQIGFSVSDSTTTTTLCSVDSQTFVFCTSPYRIFNNLSEGAHALTVRATDSTEHSSDTTLSWTVDYTAPSIAITGGPTGATNTHTPTFSFTTDAVQLRCSIDNGAYLGCGNPFTTGYLSSASHKLVVEAFDAAGNTAFATRDFWVDTIPPFVGFDLVLPAQGWPLGYVAFKWNTLEYATFECSLDGAAFSTCDTPTTVAPGFGASHTFTVRATDLAGNQDTQSRTWTATPGRVLRYPYTNGSTANTSTLALAPSMSPSGSIATLPVVGGWSHTAAGSPPSHVYFATRGALTSSPDGTYLVTAWIRPTAAGAGTIWSNATASDGLVLSYAAGKVTLEVRDAGTSSTISTDAPKLQWYSVAVRSLGPNQGVELWLDGNLAGATASSASGGFGATQANNMIVGPLTGVDLDDLELYNTAFASDQVCAIASRGSIANGSCIPARPVIELSFDHGVVDSGGFHLDLSSQGAPQFPPFLGIGLLPAGPTTLSGASFVPDLASMTNRAFTTWITTTTASTTDSIMDFTSPSCGGGSFRCGLRVSFAATPAPSIEVDATTSSGQFGSVAIPVAAGRHSITVLEHRTGDVTTSVEILVDGGTTTSTQRTIALGDGALFSAANAQLVLPSTGTISIDELQVWDVDVSSNAALRCELALDGERQPNDTCKLIP